MSSIDEVELDWWSKYWASVDEHASARKIMRHGSPPIGSKFIPNGVENLHAMSMDKSYGRQLAQHRKPKKIAHPIKAEKLVIYNSELENHYDMFQDSIRTYDLVRGKDNEGTVEERRVGLFKGLIKICKHPLPTQFEQGIIKNAPSNEQLHVLVRVYVVKATDLHPADLNGKADPYIHLQLGKQSVCDKDNYISKQLNPIFGKCFEMEALFPHESQLLIQVWDWDLVGRDDLIGETRIDLENRFYSKHRATCGIAKKYHTDGYNAWRDWLKPTQILARLCEERQVGAPVYLPSQVRVDDTIFVPDEDYLSTMSQCDNEQLALFVLRNWQKMPGCGFQLVPEHVETRTLYHPAKPGIPQGYLQLWIDLFAMNLAGASKPPVDITPRKPKGYQLRVVIWNTEDVVLEDDAFLTGEKMSDIYVKGRLKGPEDEQSTDVHYRSLTGEGNFNWRFIFNFDYLEAEEMIILKRRESYLDWDETELKIPAKLELQVWDADSFSADDFLGSLIMDLNSMPRGAKTARSCSVAQTLRPDDDLNVDLFKTRRVKGWWPFMAKNDAGQYELTGKVEAELHLLTAQEAEQNQAGFGRNAPNALDAPRRPDSSFVWFVNPLISARHILWKNHKCTLLKFGSLFIILLFFLILLYSLPGILLRKALG